MVSDRQGVGASITLPPDMVENLRDAASMARICTSWGSVPGSEGRRVAGYFYENADVVKANVFPAHSIAATRALVLFLASAIDAQPQSDSNHED